MKLLRFGAIGAEKPGIFADDDTIYDLSSHVDDIGGETLSNVGIGAITNLDLDQLPTVEQDVRLAPCVANTGKFVCIGLNYSDHAAEAGMAVPSEPVVFIKATSAIC